MGWIVCWYNEEDYYVHQYYEYFKVEDEALSVYNEKRKNIMNFNVYLAKVVDKYVGLEGV